MKNKRLGRGLEALIPNVGSDEKEIFGARLFEVDVDKLRANPSQPRMAFDRTGLDELKQSISENGVIQPITVRQVEGGFEVIAGERRLRAVQELGFQRIPVYVIELSSEDQMLELALVENIQREDLNPIELAKGYQRLQKEYGLTQDAVAMKVGKDRATVANFIRLLKLPDIIQNSLQKGEITMGHARAIMGLPSQAEQTRIWRKALKQDWSVRKTEEMVRSQSSEHNPLKKKKDADQSSAYLVDLEDRLREILGTQVRIKASGKKGRIEIVYYSDEDLTRIIDVIHGIG